LEEFYFKAVAALEEKDIQYGDVDIPEEDFKKAEEDLKK
jgi:hypothetical protein